jgi:hypothetical protein
VLDDVAAAVAQLPGLPDLEAFWDAVDARLAEGGATFLADLGIGLRETYGVQDPGQQPVPHVRAALDGLVRRLAMLPWPGHVEEALRLAAGAAISARYVASLLATGQDVQDLLVVLDDGADRGGPLGMRACLVQELVLRGRPAPVRMPAGHPLSVLPTELSELEREPPMPRYGLDWTSYPTLLPSDAGRETLPTPGTWPAPFVVTPGADTAAAAFGAWTGADVGNRLVEVVEPIPEADDAAAGAVATIVAALNTGSRSAVPITPELAWRLLFAAASMGGASTRGEYGAHGRLAAWRSLGGLTGSAEDASTALIESRVRTVGWFRLAGRADGDDGHGDTRDVGLAALDSERTHLAVLTAHDGA